MKGNWEEDKQLCVETVEYIVTGGGTSWYCDEGEHKQLDWFDLNMNNTQFPPNSTAYHTIPANHSTYVIIQILK